MYVALRFLAEIYRLNYEMLVHLHSRSPCWLLLDQMTIEVNNIFLSTVQSLSGKHVKLCKSKIIQSSYRMALGIFVIGQDFYPEVR